MWCLAHPLPCCASRVLSLLRLAGQAGEGALLGGSVVMGGPVGGRLPVFVHLESKFGDVADPADLLAAVK